MDLEGPIKKLKLGQDVTQKEQTKVFNLFPAFIARIILFVASFFIYDLGITLNRQMTKEHFGVGVVSNVSKFGIKTANATTVSVVCQVACLIMGAIKELPSVDSNGKPCIRRKMRMNISLDSRVYNPFTASDFNKAFLSVFENTQEYL